MTGRRGRVAAAVAEQSVGRQARPDRLHLRGNTGDPADVPGGRGPQHIGQGARALRRRAEQTGAGQLLRGGLRRYHGGHRELVAGLPATGQQPGCGRLGVSQLRGQLGGSWAAEVQCGDRPGQREERAGVVLHGHRDGGVGAGGPRALPTDPDKGSLTVADHELRPSYASNAASRNRAPAGSPTADNCTSSARRLVNERKVLSGLANAAGLVGTSISSRSAVLPGEAVAATKEPASAAMTKTAAAALARRAVNDRWVIAGAEPARCP